MVTVTFQPAALSDLECLCLILDYILEEESSVRSLADDYEIGRSTAGRYLQQAYIYDKKLDDLVKHKAKSRYWGQNLPRFRRRLPIKPRPYKLKPALFSHLKSRYLVLCGLTELPPNLGAFLWDGYNKTSK